jgi:DNA-directed RNA polymerase specialized sigma24 family protein
VEAFVPEQTHSEPHERLELFNNHCVERIPSRQAEILVLESLGLTDADVAAALGISSSTVQSTAGLGRSRVLPAECDATRMNANLWAILHHRCCLATQWSQFAGVDRKIG